MVSINFQGNGNIEHRLKQIGTNGVRNGNATIEQTKDFAYGITHSNAEVEETLMRKTKKVHINFVQGIKDALFGQRIQGKGNILKQIGTNGVRNGNAAIERTKDFAYGITHSNAEIKETIMRKIKKGIQILFK